MRRKLGLITPLPVDNPLAELQELAGKCKAWMAVCEEHVAELERLSGASAEAGEYVRAVVVLFERAVEAFRKVLVDVAKLDIDERLTAVTERQIGQAFEIVMFVFAKRGLSLADGSVRADVDEAIAALASGRRVIEGRVAA